MSITLTLEEAKELIFNKIKSHGNPAGRPISIQRADFNELANSQQAIEKILEAFSDLLRRGYLYHSNDHCPLFYAVTDYGKSVIFENWTDTTTTESFLGELRTKRLLFSQELEDLICEFNIAYEKNLPYSANLVLSLSTELALAEILPDGEYGNFSGKISALENSFGNRNLWTRIQRDLINFAYRMNDHRNSYSHLNPSNFNFLAERQDFVRFLENVKITKTRGRA